MPLSIKETDDQLADRNLTLCGTNCIASEQVTNTPLGARQRDSRKGSYNATNTKPTNITSVPMAFALEAGSFSHSTPINTPTGIDN